MKKQELTYTQAIKEIEAIVEKLENSELNVDELNEDVKRASELIAFCKSQLHTTEKQIDKILEDIDNSQ